MTSAADLPERIAHFRVLSLLGKGGMGVVYRAEDEKLRRTVALKVLPAAAEKDEERRRRFMREARSAAGLTHANIATIHEVGEDGGRVFIAMELVEGETLRRRISAGPLSVREAMRIARGIARGLAKAHSKGVLHRDLKPDNVILDADGEPKILDFGLAKLREPGEGDAPSEQQETESFDTQEGQLLGTPGYMSPEQAKGKGSVDERSDLFSLGVVIYEMLAGKRPFRGDAALEVLIAVSRDKPEPLEGVPPEVAAIVDRCLAKRAADRYASARELVDAMDAVQSMPGTHSAPSGPAVAQSDVPSTRISLEAKAGSRSLKSRLGRLAVVVLAVLGIVEFETYKSCLTRPAPAVIASAAPSASAPHRGIALTDRPPPKTNVPEAAAAYAQALQDLRDASLVLAGVQLEKATRLDPTLAAAHLRAAITSGAGSTTKRREHLAAAEQLRAALDEHDQMLLKVTEAGLAEPQDVAESFARIRAAAERFPDDAEFAWMLGGALMGTGRLDEARSQWLHALDLDPAYATVLWELGGSYWLNGPRDAERSLAYFARCLEIAPSAGSCLRRRDSIFMDTGQCDKLEADARTMTAVEPSGTRPYEFLAMALAARNAPRDAIEQVLGKRVSVAAEGEARSKVALQNAFWTATLVGDLGAGEAAARQMLANVEGAQTEGEHDLPMGFLLDVFQERGDDARALAEAEAFERRAAAWTPDNPIGTRFRLLFLRYAAGRIDQAALTAGVDALVQKALVDVPPDSRRIVRALPGWYVRTPQQASAVLDSLVDAGAGTPHTFNGATVEALVVGRTYFVAGRPADALAPLRQAAGSCKVLMDDESFGSDTIYWMRAHLMLGQALEQTGDTTGACSAYAVVLDRWRDAKPRSVTLDKARERSRALGCPKP